jgi:hypothetical protein
LSLRPLLVAEVIAQRCLAQVLSHFQG